MVTPLCRYGSHNWAIACATMARARSPSLAAISRCHLLLPRRIGRRTGPRSSLRGEVTAQALYEVLGAYLGAIAVVGDRHHPDQIDKRRVPQTPPVAELLAVEALLVALQEPF